MPRNEKYGRDSWLCVGVLKHDFLFNNFYIIIFGMNILSSCLCTMCIPSAQGKSKRILDPLTVELWKLYAALCVVGI